MCKSPLHQFLAELPKCEHHLHLEGCLTPALVFKLAAKNGVALPSPEDDPAYASPESLAAHYDNFGSLEDFLQCYYRGLRVLVAEADFELLAWEYFVTAAEHGVRHAEVFFDPQSHTERGVAFDTVVRGFKAACDRARRELGITTRLIMCFLRHLPPASAAETLASAVEGGHLDGDGDHHDDDNEARRTITGFGLDSSEVGFRPELFADVYREAERRGVRRTAHGGEEGDPTYISGALDGLRAERIDHGVRLVEDPALLRRVVEEEILLTVCPLSNVCLRVVEHVGQLPIREFLDAGVRFSINSDDPAYFGGYVLHNFCAVQQAFDFTIDEWRLIAENSIHGSWIGEKRRLELLSEVAEVVERHR
ncbi:uncharacterized protein E0L32_009453 [Thyridium curvatum]|uniref:Adenine deaminase n=1 Tax=Thyridium curvatum TaxID=1093900 RepID=A0A507AWN6_9PEZI|nr:uncharacterized protein E0L32_009453 [Thyridium curvatum]TPX09409.1 hypothetical protein E0L32_009453 [Thyridium curvatum]